MIRPGRNYIKLFAAATALAAAPLLAASHILAAEQQNDPPPIILERQIDPAEAELTQQLNLARRLMQEQNWQGAEAVLETLYEKNPTHGVVISQLMKCLDELKQYPKAVDLVNREIERSPNNIHLHLRLAEYMVKQDSLKAALAVYNRTIGMAGENNLGYLQSIVNNLVFYGFPDRAAELIDSLRAVEADSTLFALQKGGIYEQKRSYDLATREFYKLLADTTRAAIDAETKLVSLLDFPTSSEASLKELKTLAERDNNVKVFKILSDYYLKNQQFEPAFDYAVKRNADSDETGAGLLTFLRNCRERKLHSETIRMARFILDNYPNSPILPETYFVYASSLSESGDLTRAIAVYDTIAAVMPRAQDKSAALYEIGAIYSDRKHDCDSALIYYDSVIAHYPAGAGHLDALMARPTCYMRLGRYDKARIDFEGLKKRHLDELRQEKIDYDLARIDFFENNFDSANVTLRRILVDYPKGYFVNDALRLLMVMSDAEGDNDLLRLYSSAENFRMRQITDSVIAKLEDLTRTVNRSLADNALHELMNVSIASGDTTRALSYIAQLGDEFSESYYLPYGLKLKADVLMTREENRAEAAAIYRDLLEKYNNYPFSSEVREILRTLAGQEPIG